MIGLVIVGVSTLVIACICFVYSLFAFKEKGPILTNEYLLATDEERRKLTLQNPQKKSKDYRFVAQIFLGISFMFLSMFIGCMLLIFNINGSIMFLLSGLIALALIIYALVSSIRSGEFR